MAVNLIISSAKIQSKLLGMNCMDLEVSIVFIQKLLISLSKSEYSSFRIFSKILMICCVLLMLFFFNVYLNF